MAINENTTTAQPSSSDFVQSADDEVTATSCRSITKDSSKPSLALSNYKMLSASPSKSSRRISIGSEIVRFFQKYDSEESKLNLLHQQDSVSESSLNYSNVGLYDKLIQNEMTKTEYLTAFLKMRKKAIMDRTKGQIALLEVQKARYKAKGLVNNIAAIRKKQRGILMKMEKEREEIERLLQSKFTAEKTQQTDKHKKSPLKHKAPKSAESQVEFVCPPQPLPSTINLTKRSQWSIKPNNLGSSNLEQKNVSRSSSASPKLKAIYELESSSALEKLLKKREEDLRKRREHVEHLMQWHQRLDEEEAEVLQLERQLLNYNHNNNAPQQVVAAEQQKELSMPPLLLPPPPNTIPIEQLTHLHKETKDHCEISDKGPTTEKRRASRARKMEKRLKDIDKSLKELSHISTTTTSGGTTTATSPSIVMGQHTAGDIDNDNSSAAPADVQEYVRTTGFKLNKLWRRLTSQSIEKYEPNRRYKLCKADLELLYEEAKMAVLRDFAQDEERIAQELLEKSSNSNQTVDTSPPNQKVSKTSLDDPSESDDKISVLEIPILNLNFSSGHSENEEGEKVVNVPSAIDKRTTPAQGIYSPSAAEQNFKAQLHNSSASPTSSPTYSPSSTSPAPSIPSSTPSLFIKDNKGKDEAEKMREQQQRQQRIENNVQIFLALTQNLQMANGNSYHSNLTGQQQHQGEGLQRSYSDTQISEIPKFSSKATTSHNRTGTINTSQTETETVMAIQQQQNHQRSKSNIVETIHIPPTPHPSHSLSHSPKKSKEIESKNRNKIVQEERKSLNNLRPSVISSVGKPESSLSTTKSSVPSPPARQTFSHQVGLSSEQRAKEISCKLDEISEAVIKLSQANSLPSYPVATGKLAPQSPRTPTGAAGLRVDKLNLHEESNLSTETSSPSSYSINFANISIDRHSSPGSKSQQETSDTLATTTTSPNPTHRSTTPTSHTTTFTINSNKKTLNQSANKESKECIKDPTTPTIANATTTITEGPEINNDKPSAEEYEPDFEAESSDNETHIEDISLPLYETTTAETTTTENGVTIEEEEEVSTGGSTSINENSKNDIPAADKTFCTKTNVSAEESPKGKVSNVVASSATSSKEQLPPPPLPQPPLPPPCSTVNSSPNSNQLMPDIINELELRRHQLIIDNEHLKQYEHVTAVPYMYVREIPNKPPPPYVPPAHGSPMTTIFPSEERIKDITFRRTHELYCELLKTEYCNEKGEKLPSVMGEQITNIYERIILDICREYLEEHNEILRDGDPINFHSQLAFFNPPNRLRCIQNAIYKEVRLCLGMDKQQPKRTQIYSVYGQRAKQDHIGKIIIQEMYDDDDRWCNFHREESEVLQLIVEEMIQKNIAGLAREVLVEEGGTIEPESEENLNNDVDIEEIDCTAEIEDNNVNEEESETLRESNNINDLTVVYKRDNINSDSADDDAALVRV